MRILMLSWEYPPRNIGGLSNHVYYLARALARLNHEVHVVTCMEGTAPLEELKDGVYVHRVSPLNIKHEDFLKGIMHLNFAIIEECVKILKRVESFDLIHAHDWLVGYAAKVLKGIYNLPIVTTIHATEHGRNNGIHSELQRYIHSSEVYLTSESDQVIVCSKFMLGHVKEVLEVAEDKLTVIANGVDYTVDTVISEDIDIGENYSKQNEKIVFFIGRHVFEKGIHILVEAIPRIISSYNDAKFIIAGTGPMTEELRNRINVMNLSDKVIFVGYMEDHEKQKLYKISDAAVFPSLFEPFGIVALEAMAAGCPVIVSDTGGFSELVEHEETGLKTVTGDPSSVADNVLRLFFDNELADRIKKNALRKACDDYSWDSIAEKTSEVYQGSIKKYINEYVKRML